MKTIKDKIKKFIPNIALAVGQKSVNQACVWWFNQPKVPDSMKKDNCSK